MVLKTADRVLETSNTTGTSAYSLIGAVTNFRGFVAALGNGAKTSYLAADNANWEVGIGTVTAGSPNTLTRDTVLYSSNSNAAVNWGGGTRNIFCAPVADTLVHTDEFLNNVSYFSPDTGLVNAHVVTLPVAPKAYSDGMMIAYRVNITNTSSTVNVNVNSLGNKRLKINGSDPVVGQLQAGMLLIGFYKSADNTFEIINQVMNLTGPINFAKGVDIAAASTTDIGAATGNFIHITGTGPTINSLGTAQAGTVRFTRFAGSVTLTHNATSQILPGAANIITNTDDTAIFISEGSGNWRCLDYNRSIQNIFVNFNGSANSNINGTYSQSGTTVTITATAHGHLVGHQVSLDYTSGTAVDGVFTVVSVPNANTFTVTAAGSLTTSGNVTLLRNTIRKSAGVQSVSDIGVGIYAVNFSPALPDSEYGFTLGARRTAGTSLISVSAADSTAPSAASLSILATSQTGGTSAQVDPTHLTVNIQT